MSANDEALQLPHNDTASSRWRGLWQANKGALLILLSEIAGSSMDAIVRFLQQGGHGIHPFQVRLIYIYLTRFAKILLY